jgi:hypothetical protein
LLDLSYPDSTPQQTIDCIHFFNTHREVFILTAFAADRTNETAWLKAKCALAGARMMYGKDEISVIYLLQHITFVHARRVLAPQLVLDEHPKQSRHARE